MEFHYTAAPVWQHEPFTFGVLAGCARVIELIEKGGPGFIEHLKSTGPS